MSVVQIKGKDDDFVADVNADGALLVRTGAGGGGLTDNELRATPVPVSVASLPLPSGAATQTTLAAILARQADGSQHVIIDSMPAGGSGLTDAELRASAVPVSATSLPLPSGAATEASLGTDGAAPPVIAGTGVRGWLRAIYDRLVAGIARTWTLSSGTDSVTVSGTVTASGPLTDAQLRAATVPVSGTVTASGPVTDAQIRATPLPVSGPLTDAQIRATPLPVSGTFYQATQPVSGTFYQATQPVSAASLPLPADAATQTTLATRLADETFTGRINTQGQKTMAVSTPVVLASDQSAIPVSGPLTDAQVRATPLPVSGPVTDAQIRATPLPVSGPLTDAQLRAAVVPISVATLPLPTGAATDAILTARLGVLGQATMANSAPVVVASDNGLALDATITGGLQKTLVRGAARDVIAAADATATRINDQRVALDVSVYSQPGGPDPDARCLYRETRVPLIATTIAAVLVVTVFLWTEE